jgi:Asp-tRNA(Asn)/Glu-tRNA(Gln) amidotransferase A subunit family amidase
MSPTAAVLAGRCGLAPGQGRKRARLRHIDGIWITEVDRPAEGIRLAVKDLFDTAGLTTTYGSVIFAEHVPAETAEAVRRLEAAGYANVGKANLHEFAYGTTSLNVHFGAVPNPIAPDRIAGGSSGGSAAALSAGLADAALGTDSGGSIRIPSACCGTVGLKPTYGLVPLDGCFPLAPSFDHAGPMARDVAACAAMMHALVPGFEGHALESLEEVRVGVAWLEHADPGIRERVRRATTSTCRSPKERSPSSCGRSRTSTARSSPTTPTPTDPRCARRSSAASTSPTATRKRPARRASCTASTWPSWLTAST